MKIKKLLSEKGIRKNTITISEDATLKEAAEKLCEAGVGAILVMSPGTGSSRHVGIISERDILKRCCTDDDFRQVKVSQIMTRNLIIAKIDDDVEYVMRVMMAKHIRHMPILDGNDIVTVVSIRDLVYSILEEDKLTIRHLSDYCQGGGSHSEVF